MNRYMLVQENVGVFPNTRGAVGFSRHSVFHGVFFSMYHLSEYNICNDDKC